ncbi:MAG: hypothetical protein JOZ24_07570 [Candidatus Eremiobacteraeota bacterium]|nr:hypothetical protein [Candidatus Eremiobacteraeota bacterium]
MVHRFAAAALLCVGLVACKENDAPVATQLFQGVGDVHVLDARVVPSGESSPATATSQVSYVIVRVELRNDLGTDLVPTADHFYLIDRTGTRYQGKDSGSSALLGISNSTQILKKDETREYTVAFRTNDSSISGQIVYER